MAYEKINWTETTPITASNLNQMEEGIANSLQKEHPSACFGYNSTTGRITHNENDVTVFNSVRVNNMQIRGGAGLSGADGYITFSW